jgi:tetratricopeptide (TPR) repeat protein
MTTHFKKRAGLCLLLAGMAACSSSPPPRPPAPVEQMNAVDKAASRAARDGDWLAARTLFEQSRRLHQAQDDMAGSATATINLASVYHHLGKNDIALQLLDSIASEPSLPYPAQLRSVAAFRKSVILADDGQQSAAAAALDDAVQGCPKSCDFMAGVNNLRARLALAKKDHASALTLAKAAADAAGGDKSELANARRYAGDAEIGLQHNEPALEHYLAALELDKQMGLSERIAEDLDGAAKALARLGRKDEAEAYARRAAVVRAALPKSNAAPAQSLSE